MSTLLTLLVGYGTLPLSLRDFPPALRAVSPEWQ